MSSAIPASSIMLIHGAWAASWIWEGIAGPLREAGYTVATPDLMGCGNDTAALDQATFELAVARLVDVFDSLPQPVAIAGHSGGGLFASAVAQARPEQTVSVIYIAGFMLPAGWHYDDVCKAVAADASAMADPTDIAGIQPHLISTHNGKANRVSVSGAVQVFFQDCPPDAARAAATRLGDFPNALRQTVPDPASTDLENISRVYIECLADRSINIAAQRKMQALVPGAQCIQLNTGHAPMLADPVGLIESIRSVIYDDSNNSPRS